MDRMTDTCKNITLPQTSFVGGNKAKNCISTARRSSTFVTNKCSSTHETAKSTETQTQTQTLAVVLLSLVLFSTQYVFMMQLNHTDFCHTQETCMMMHYTDKYFTENINLKNQQSKILKSLKYGLTLL